MKSISEIEKVRELYETTADSYAKTMDTEIALPIYADILGRFADRLADVPGALVDTSCGTGHMLCMYHECYDRKRALVGVDLSPRMIAIATEKLGHAAELHVGDMSGLGAVQDGSAAGVLSFFALHHTDPSQAATALHDWNRVSCAGGQLVVAAWEGSGPIDYGESTNVVAYRYTADEISAWVRAAGFVVDDCKVRPVDDMPMDAIYLEATKP